MTATAALVLQVSGALALPAQQPAPGRGTADSTIALTGRWRLNLARTHYGGGADVRRSEDFDCAVVANKLRCTIESVRQNGQRVVGQFDARLDGSAGAVRGITGVDSMRLLRHDAGVADATFSLGGKPVLGYRAYRSPDGRSLTIISVDPVTRVALNSVVVYDRR
ncbi:MAG TPA: hypothetical protein VGH04_09040 [Gemmatimonadaceae bacterium]